jgi:DNA topoisomerase-2
MIDALNRELLLLSNKAKYIQENLDDTIDLRKKKKEQVIQLLEEKGYDVIDNDIEFKYLTKMPMDSVTEENVARLFKEKGSKEAELETIKTTTVNQIWTFELDKLREEYIQYKEERQRLMSGTETKKKKVVSKGGAVISKKSSSNKLIIKEDDN